MPVLRENDILETTCETVDHRHDFVAMRDRQRAARNEIVLHIDDDEAGIYFFASCRISTRARSAAV